MILKHISDRLRRLFRSHSQRGSEAAFEMSASLEKKILVLVENMPTLPDTATQLLAMTDDPATKFGDMASVIEKDPSLAKAVLQRANSALFAAGAPAVSLEKAVARLGVRECKHVVLAIGVRSLFRKISGDMKDNCERLWHHGAVTADFCRQLNRSLRLGLDGLDYSAGLLHDLGRMLLVLADSQSFSRADGLEFEELPGILERERAVIGIDHAALGGWFGEHSRLPDAIIQTMQHHHTPELVQSTSTGRLVSLVATADHLANFLHRKGELDNYHADDNAGLQCLMTGWPQAKRERLLSELETMIHEIGVAPDRPATD